jgi:hypothetical protein
MFGRSLVGGMVLVALSSISPGLVVIGLIVIPIIMIIMDNKEEKADDIAKYGYSARHEKFENLPPERKRVVNEIRNNEKIAKSVEIQQIYRRQFDKYVSQTTIHRGGYALAQDKKHKTPVENQLPSLDYYQNMANTLPSHLGNELMSAARAESRACAAKDELLFGIDRNTAFENYRIIRANFVEIIDKCNNSKNVIAKNSSGEQSAIKDEIPREPPKPYAGYSDDLFN